MLNRDLRTAATGVAIAAVSGVVMGAAMRPNLDGKRIQGPQMLTPAGAPRDHTDEAVSADWSRYQGALPTYVVGTDSLRPPAPAEDAPPGAEDATPDPEDEPPPQAEIERTGWQEPPSEPTRYLSLDGDEPLVDLAPG